MLFNMTSCEFFVEILRKKPSFALKISLWNVRDPYLTLETHRLFRGSIQKCDCPVFAYFIPIKSRTATSGFQADAIPWGKLGTFQTFPHNSYHPTHLHPDTQLKRHTPNFSGTVNHTNTHALDRTHTHPKIHELQVFPITKNCRG